MTDVRNVTESGTRYSWTAKCRPGKLSLPSRRQTSFSRGRPASGVTGFALVELVAVVTVAVILVAIAVPNILVSVRRRQFESTATNVSEILLRTRYEAIQRNQRLSTVFAGPTPGVPAQYGIDRNGNAALDAGEPTVMIFQGVSVQNTGPALDTMPPGYSAGVAPANLQISFAPRGTLVTETGPGVWQDAASVQVLFLWQADLGQWLAVTVTPAGRIRTFQWSRRSDGTWGWVS